MAKYFTVTEIIKYFELNTNGLFYYSPFVFFIKVSTQNLSDSYFITVFGAVDVTNKEILNIQGLYIDIDNFYPVQESLNDCITTEESIFFDGENQFLYIHINHLLNPYSVLTEYGKTFGYTNDGVRNFNGIDYNPQLISIPNLSNGSDPLQYGRQSFFGGDHVYNNTPVKPGGNGDFDTDEQLHGNDTNVLFGENGNTYEELKRINKNYIDETIIDFEKAILKTKDKREQQSTLIPNEFFNNTDYPFIDDDLIDQIKPEAYGDCVGIPGICINFKETGVNKKFYFSSDIFALNIVYAKKNNIWDIVAPISVNNGIIELLDSDAYIDGDNTKGLNDIKANGIFLNYLNPADITSAWNLRYLNVPFNNTNYNTAEWNNEKQYLGDVGIYLDSQKEIYSYIEELQNGSTVGFQYIIEYGKRTIRLDNPNRDPIFRIEAVEIINNNNLKKNNNEELFATDAVVFYEHDYTENKSLRFKNTDYYEQVFRQHRKNKTFEIESLFLSENRARNKSIIIMEDQQKTRFIISVILSDMKYFDLRIYDIVEIELSYPGEKYKTEYVDQKLIKFSGDVPDGIFVTRSAGDVWKKVNYRRRDIYINKREFEGWQRMQVIGLLPDFTAGIINVTLRQRNYSSEYERITGFTP